MKIRVIYFVFLHHETSIVDSILVLSVVLCSALPLKWRDLTRNSSNISNETGQVRLWYDQNLV